MAPRPLLESVQHSDRADRRAASLADLQRQPDERESLAADLLDVREVLGVVALQLAAEDMVGEPHLRRVLARLDAGRVLTDVDNSAFAVEVFAALEAEPGIVGDVCI